MSRLNEKAGAGSVRGADDIASAGRATSGKIKITALATGFVMASLDITVVNVAGATIQARLHTTLTELTWVVDGYVLTFASLLLLGGGVANRVGAKTAYMRGMGVFFVASLACALAPSGGALIGARLVQGAGAALFMPSSLALLVYSFPDRRERTRMLGLWSAIVAASAGFGPTIGGIVVNALGWRSVFLLNLPIGLVGMLMTHRHIAPAAGRSTRLAVPGHIVWITALAALSYALIEGPHLGWYAASVLVAFAVGVIATGLLVARERRTDNPIMPWALFRDPCFSGANAVGFLFNLALFGNLFMLGLFFQHARGASPFRAGLELLPVTFSFPLANVVFSRVSARFTNGTLLTVFLLVAGVASISMIGVSPGTPYWVMAVVIGVANVGAGVIAPAMTAALVDAAGREHANIGGSMLNANRQLGSLVGVAAVGAVLHVAHDWYQGASASFLLVGVVYLIGALCAWRLIAQPGGEKRPSPRFQ
ncbi:MFS transporter [Actinoallomurus purpureus]|uniref:MFS transporter n=1 Tax=Actinoallomurus purpureus TaxID=478114 RepID=UPI002092C0D4|nr:MFS transporter [Actinoallomurus purpureus]MCO6004062.1 MFS transporter [Actinoallomurus purpureus]